ncbi:hypothetical protein RZS08_63245, partial [Arthrospira platensis SPKY1]|nr:hypothetical protein [Arthrospira platensis SPKY1]
MQNKYLISGILWLYLALLTWGCGNGPGQAEQGPRIYAELFVRYLQSERELKATATFFEGDSLNTAAP